MAGAVSAALSTVPSPSQPQKSGCPGVGIRPEIVVSHSTEPSKRARRTISTGNQHELKACRCELHRRMYRVTRHPIGGGKAADDLGPRPRLADGAHFVRTAAFKRRRTRSGWNEGETRHGRHRSRRGDIRGRALRAARLPPRSPELGSGRAGGRPGARRPD